MIVTGDKPFLSVSLWRGIEVVAVSVALSLMSDH